MNTGSGVFWNPTPSAITVVGTSFTGFEVAVFRGGGREEGRDRVGIARGETISRRKGR